MSKDKCEHNNCKVPGHYKHGSALYDYYTCGHAYEKPLGKEKGKWVLYESPYSPYPTASRAGGRAGGRDD